MPPRDFAFWAKSLRGQKRFPKILLESSKWITTFWIVPAEISGSNWTSEKVALFFRTEYAKGKSSKPFLVSVSGLRGFFSVKGTDLYKW